MSENQAVTAGICLLIVVALVGFFVFYAAPKLLGDTSLMSEHPTLPANAGLAFSQMYLVLIGAALLVPFALMLIFL